MSSAPAEPAMRSDAARNHLRIVTAAAAAFEEDGAAVPLDEIARRAGVGIATLYRRFGTREELIKAAGAQGSDAAREHTVGIVVANSIKKAVTSASDPKI